jgi:DNA-binding IclR family transcriptional regulator
VTDKKAGSEKKVGALVSGLNVIRYLVRAPSAVGVSQVARDVKISPSTCFNLLRTLVLEQLVDFDPATKNYSISYGLLELTKGMIERDQIVQFLKPRLTKMALDHRVTATLWRRVADDRVILVERADAESAVRIHMTVGQRLPMFIGALGRCMAAFSGLSKDVIRRQFEVLRWENPPEFEEYWDDLKEARTRGYAIDRDHFVRGITTIAAPVFDAAGAPVLVVSAVGFSGQFSDAALRAIADEAKACSEQGTEWLSGASEVM